MTDRAVPPDQVRVNLERRAQERGETMRSLSIAIGRNEAYLQQFVQRGTPKQLPEDARLMLAQILMIDERELGARDPWVPPVRRRVD